MAYIDEVFRQIEGLSKTKPQISNFISVFQRFFLETKLQA